MGGPEALQKMGTLSGGQKSRIAFAQIMWQKPHVLLLDEPTNHLDLDAVEALIHALLDFKGGLLVISHDEHLVSSICGELWVAEPGRVAVYKDSFENWRERERKPGPHHSLQSDQALHDVKTQSMGHGCSSQSRVSS